MRKLVIYFVLGLVSLQVSGQDPDGNYNPYVNSGVISPAPLLPTQMGGTGTLSFNFGNTGSDPCEVFTGHQITLVISLSGGEPDNVDPLAAISGTAAGLFSWTYNSGTYTGIQTAPVGAGFVGIISIAYKVTQNSPASGSNGFNVNITPAPYQNTSNSPNDDAVSSYTYTEYRDYGDAPATYGEVNHNIDFDNYLGSSVDGENAQLYSSSATGDDSNGSDDEDGVDLSASFARGAIVDIPVTVTGVGRLNAWIDWNGNGTFEDAGERIASNLIYTEGTSNLSVSVPTDAIISAPTFARFRFSSTSLSTSTGSFEGGEVEDYQISVSCDPPIATLTSDAPGNSFCSATEVTFTAGGGSNYAFRVDAEVVQDGSSNVFTTNALSNGEIVDVVVTDASGCSSVSSGISNTVLPLPTATLVSDDADDSFCEGTAVLFTAGGGQSYNFRVDEVSVQDGSGTTYSTTDLADGQVVDVVVTGSNGCIAQSTGISNTVNDNPVATLLSSDSDDEICEGEQITFTAEGGSYFRFRINGTSVQSGSASTFVTNTLSDGHVVEVIVNNTFGCSDTSAGITTTVNQRPTVSAGDPIAEICQGESTASLQGSYGGSATGVSWSSTVGGTFQPSASDPNARWTPPSGYSGTASLALTTSGGSCGVVSSEVSQVVNPTPVLVISNPEPICSPGTIDLTSADVTSGSSSGLVYSYWIDAEATQAYPTPSTANAGTYYIVGTNASGCSDIQSVMATIFETPSAPTVSTNAASNPCPETFVDLTSLVTSNPPSGGSILYNQSNSPTASSVLDPENVGTGVYYLYYESSDGCYSAGTEVNVAIIVCPPDLTPTVTVSPNVMNGPTDFNLIVRITELNTISSSGPIIVKIPKDTRWVLKDGFDNALTSLGSTALDNGDWSYSDDVDNHIFHFNSLIPASDYSSFGFVVNFDPGSSRGTYTITTQIESGGGGEIRVNNNVDSEKIDYFQE